MLFLDSTLPALQRPEMIVQGIPEEITRGQMLRIARSLEQTIPELLSHHLRDAIHEGFIYDGERRAFTPDPQALRESDRLIEARWRDAADLSASMKSKEHAMREVRALAYTAWTEELRELAVATREFRDNIRETADEQTFIFPPGELRLNRDTVRQYNRQFVDHGLVAARIPAQVTQPSGNAIPTREPDAVLAYYAEHADQRYLTIGPESHPAITLVQAHDMLLALERKTAQAVSALDYRLTQQTEAPSVGVGGEDLDTLEALRESQHHIREGRERLDDILGNRAANQPQSSATSTPMTSLARSDIERFHRHLEHLEGIAANTDRPQDRSARIAGTTAIAEQIRSMCSQHIVGLYSTGKLQHDHSILSGQRTR